MPQEKHPFEDVRRDWGFVEGFTLHDAIHKWSGFVEDLERGYRLSSHDFEVELYFREDLHELLPRLIDTERIATSADLEALDERYIQATVPTDHPVLAPSADSPTMKLWGRRPAVLAPVDGEVCDTWDDIVAAKRRGE